MSNTSSKMTLIELYELYESQKSRDENYKNAQALLQQTHWFTVNAYFDPKTGEALPQALSVFLKKVAKMPPATTPTILHDRLWRITDHARSSVERLFRSLNESPRREHAMLPLRAVRELDANSFIKLSNRPGRTIREKVAGRPYLQAVRRFQSVNLPENRLLKAFVTRLSELLELRRDCLKEEDDLLPKIESWLLSDEAQALDRWDNLPPNNTLLSHRDYRRIWDAWRWLQAIDDNITDDFSRFEARAATKRQWENFGRQHREGTHRFADMPLLFDYENFEIKPWRDLSPHVRKTTSRPLQFLTPGEIRDAVCIDLALLRPRYASGETSTEFLSETYLWQEWKNDRERVDIALFASDAAYFHLDATSIASPDLFSRARHSPEHLDRAARAFATRLRNTFKHDTLIWLVPDFLSDFELETIRRNLNTCFPGAEPLPRSVAAAFERVDYSKITGNGYAIVVTDTFDGLTSATKLIARFDPDLEKLCPETNGYYWERCPPVITSQPNEQPATDNQRVDFDMLSVDIKGQWRDSRPRAMPQFIEASLLKQDPRIGSFAFCINSPNSPVAGGIHLHALQQTAGDIPLWRDQIPELSITVMKNGRRQRFYLVTRGTTVKPIRGMSVPIPVHDNFTLPAKQPFYEFRLFQGENQDDLGFSARLDSPAFPLPQATLCKLNLTFQYGADEPYTLIFTPLDKSFAPIRATWRPTVNKIITDAPSPEYPKSSSWRDLRSWRDAQGNQVDLLEWLMDSLTRLLAMIPKRGRITLSSSWKAKTDVNGNNYWFAFARTEEGKECYCNTKQLAGTYRGNPDSDFPPGTQLYGDLRTRSDGSVTAFNISSKKDAAISLETQKRIVSFKESSLQNRMALIWADARSLRDPTCSVRFRDDFHRVITAILNALPPDTVDRKMMFLLACLHKDTTDECVQWLSKKVEKGKISDPRAVGFALGDVSMEWQRAIYCRLVSPPTYLTIRAFAYAIWRDQRFVEHLSVAEIQEILKVISRRMEAVRAVKRSGDDKEDKWIVSKWVRETAEPLELLLGLLRTRASPDTEKKMVLQPHQKITKELAQQLERVMDVVAQSQVNLFSRVQLNVQKPDGDRTPDLLYALRMYLTGDDGAHAIHVASISDGEVD